MKDFTFVTISFIIITRLSGTSGFNFETRIPIVKRGPNGSAFGYSVAGHIAKIKNVQERWILVGAPTDLMKSNRSGALWKCPLTIGENDCEQVPIDYIPDSDDRIQNHTYDEWLGVTVKSDGNRIMACAHRRAVILYNRRLVTGRCYILSKNFKTKYASNSCMPNIADMEVCQYGTSVVFAPEDKVLVGAPGSSSWRGFVFDLNLNTMEHNQVETSKTQEYEYMGMSVAAGDFVRDETNCYAGGASRYGGTGGVLISCDGSYYTIQPSDGAQFSSGFGYEMITANVDNDETDDLIIGAPFYFNEVEGGAVYVFTKMSSKDYDVIFTEQKLVGRHESRFGFSIAHLGDIQMDRYADIAIGAPYEDKGAVYIYIGSKFGIVPTPSQIIRAQDTPFPLPTFGHSLSGNVDLDDNGFPDLLVGAYGSSAVFLFLSRRVIMFSNSIRSKSKHNEYLKNEIDPIDSERKGCSGDLNSFYTCFTFEACFTIHEDEDPLNLSYSIEADRTRKSPRVWFANDTKHYVNRMIPWSYNSSHDEEEHCWIETVYLKDNVRDTFSPIKFRVSYTLIEDEPKLSENVGASEYLILNQKDSILDFEVAFQKDCGDDGICVSDLRVEVDVASGQCVESSIEDCQISLGGREEIVLAINVRNHGESAYQTELNITHSPSLNYIASISKNRVNCDSRNITLVSCDIFDILKKNESVRVDVRFDPRYLENDESQLNFTVSVNTMSHKSEALTPKSLIVTVWKLAELSIKGKKREHLLEKPGNKTFEETIPDVYHNYTINNDGPWESVTIKINISFPYEMTNDTIFGTWFLHWTERPIIISGGTSICEPPVYPLSSPAILPSRTNENPHKILSMDCKTKSVKCFYIECTIYNLPRKQNAIISSRARFWNLRDANLFNVQTIQLESDAWIISHGIKQNKLSDDNAQAKTVLYLNYFDEKTTKPVPLWIILLTVTLGLLILGIISYVLHKFGFFERNRPDQTYSGNLAETIDDDSGS